jgi:glycosyltransferase involved in cell wall biosynthesis
MNLLALVESPDHVCCRYRIRAFAPALERAGCSLICEGIERGVVARTLQLARTSRFDVVILQRKLLPAWQLRILRRSARRLVFDFDDAVLYRDSNDPRGQDDPRRRHRFAATVQAADTVVAGNDFLADCALRSGARVENVHVIPTCVDTRRYPLARHDPATGGTELVWIGSSSTLKGLEQPRAIWQALAAAVPGLRIRVICDAYPRDFPLPVVPVTWDETDEARQISAGQIGVTWLPDDLWSRGKCGLKILQYQAAGLPVVANPVGCHEEMIRHGATGFLATRPEEWVESVRQLARDRDFRLRMGHAACLAVERDYSVAAWSRTFVRSTTGDVRRQIVVSGTIRRVDRPAPTAGRSNPEHRATQPRTTSSLKPVGPQ